MKEDRREQVREGGERKRGGSECVRERRGIDMGVKEKKRERIRGGYGIMRDERKGRFER